MMFMALILSLRSRLQGARAPIGGTSCQFMIPLFLEIRESGEVRMES
jgi:hypothetical protein